jgi:hypothetical protein
MKTFILYWISEFIRKHKFCQNIGKFKIGDRVTYNWRAKYQLLKNTTNFKQTFEVYGFYENGEGIETSCGQMISAHWLKKAVS